MASSGAGPVEAMACMLADLEGDRADWVLVWDEETQSPDRVRRWQSKMPAARAAWRLALDVLEKELGGEWNEEAVFLSGRRRDILGE